MFDVVVRRTSDVTDVSRSRARTTDFYRLATQIRRPPLADVGCPATDDDATNLRRDQAPQRSKLLATGT